MDVQTFFGRGGMEKPGDAPLSQNLGNRAYRDHYRNHQSCDRYCLSSIVITTRHDATISIQILVIACLYLQMPFKQLKPLGGWAHLSRLSFPYACWRDMMYMNR